MKQLSRIFSFTRSLWLYYLAISIFTILLSLMTQLQPLFTKAAIDQISRLNIHQSVNIQLVALFAVLIFITDLGQTLISNISGYLGDMMSIKLQKLMGERYYAHVMDLSQQYFDTELSGKIINRMNRGISQIGTFVQMMSNNFLQFVFSTIFSLIIVSYYSWQVGLMLFMLYPVFIFLTTRTSARWQKWQSEINNDQDIASGRFAEAIGQVRVVKSYLQEERELSFWRQLFTKVVRTTKPQSKYWHRQDVMRRLVLNVIFLFVFVYIFVQTARGQYTIGTMVLLIQYAALIRIPIFSISFLVDSTQRAVANTKDYFDILDVIPDVADVSGATILRVPKGEVVFDAVHFAYETNKSVLQGISFCVKPDSKVALVGESGEGKTTLTNLLLRFYDVNEGRIMIDSQNIAEVTQASLRANIGVVFQDPALFSGTIRENISYARPDADETAIVAAAKAANAHEFIEKFEKGYDTEMA
jgi:ATP-binding cassette subfamily B protein